jgi:hypothetical protein
MKMSNKFFLAGLIAAAFVIPAQADASVTVDQSSKVGSTQVDPLSSVAGYQRDGRRGEARGGRADRRQDIRHGDRNRNGQVDRRWDRNQNRQIDRRFDRNDNEVVDRRYDRNRDGYRDRPVYREARQDYRYDRGHSQWNQSWRSDRRYDWRGHRNRYNNYYRPGRYYAPYRNHNYNRISIGFSLGGGYYGSRYWISDPWHYRLPAAYGSYRWVRYYDDVLLVDVRNGYVADVIHNFFW